MHSFLKIFLLWLLCLVPAGARAQEAVETFRLFDTLRACVVLKNSLLPPIAARAAAEGRFYHPADAYWLAQAQDQLGDTAGASRNLLRAVALGYPTGFSASDPLFQKYARRQKKQLDSVLKAAVVFKAAHKALTDSCLYFMVNDLRLFAGGINNYGILLQTQAHLLDPNLKSHEALQERLVDFIKVRGWVGWKRLHQSYLVLPVMNLSLARIRQVEPLLRRAVATGDMLPEELGLILEKAAQLETPDNAPKKCIYAPTEFACPERWSAAIKAARNSIGMSVFLFRRHLFYERPLRAGPYGESNALKGILFLLCRQGQPALPPAV